ncbi:hypothetical protein ACFRCX_27555 [Streptomyces sp. NPDC056652]|uniref:hypothetical protein n=1 Tax=Streptomyces sp. NPDC056652 TaxID=3345893 RepID=UPI0036A8F068
MSCEARATMRDGDELRGAGVGARMRDGVCRQGVPAPRDANVRRVMLAQRSRNTAPEMALRRALHALGFRYRVDLPLPGMRRRRSDLTFREVAHRGVRAGVLLACLSAAHACAGAQRGVVAGEV